MKEITKVNLKLQELELTNYVKEIKQQKELKMSKTKSLVQKDLPISISEIYESVLDFTKNLISTKRINYNEVLNLVLTVFKHYKDVPNELDRDGLKSHLIGVVTADILDFVKPIETKSKYQVANITNLIDRIFEVVKVMQSSGKIDYSQIIGELTSLVFNAKSLMNEFNDLDNREIGIIAECISYNILEK
jgi:hypothetical protein